MVAHRLGHRGDVVFVEAARKGRAAMTRGPECDPLGSDPGVRVIGEERGHQARDADEQRRGSFSASERMHEPSMTSAMSSCRYDLEVTQKSLHGGSAETHIERLKRFRYPDRGVGARR